jgi:hypothetical protein
MLLFKVLVRASKKALPKKVQFLGKEKEKRPSHLIDKRCIATTFEFLLHGHLLQINRVPYIMWEEVEY